MQDILRNGNPDFEPAKLTAGEARERLAFICFSSGTSGLVKGVRLSHGNIVANVFQQSEGVRGMFTDATVVALIVPFFHILGLAAFCCQYVVQVRLKFTKNPNDGSCYSHYCLTGHAYRHLPEI